MAVPEIHPLPSLTTGRRWLWGLVIGAMIPVAGLGGFFFGQRHDAAQKTTLPILGKAPAYEMTNQLGEKVSSAGLHGKVRIVTFLFPYCTTLCPLIAAHLANWANLELRPAGIEDKVEIVTFNIDAADTGPAEMRAFLRQYGWNPHDPHWQYLTGSPQEMRRVVQRGFNVWYKRVGLASEARDSDDAIAVQPEIVNKLAEKAHADYDFVHNDVLEIVDQQGRIRKIYDDADTVSPVELLNAVQSLLGRSG